MSIFTGFLKIRVLILICWILPIAAICQDADIRINIRTGFRSTQTGNQVRASLEDLFSKINRAFIQKSTILNLKADYLDQKAREDLDRLWANDPFYCSGNKFQRQLIERSNGEFQIRQIPVILPGSNSTEEIVINFSSEGIINNIFYAIKEQQYLGLLSGSDKVDILHRELILDFIENFRSAYNKKDLEFLQKVYSDKALIIVGKILKADENPHASDRYYKSLGEKNVTFLKLTKAEYLTRLADVFQKAGKISVEFNNIEIVRHLKYPDYYGVSLKQIWKSGYEDEGFLFLLIQFRMEDNPLIWVRTWQDVKQFSEEDAFGLHNFVIN